MREGGTCEIDFGVRQKWIRTCPLPSQQHKGDIFHYLFFNYMYSYRVLIRALHWTALCRRFARGIVIKNIKVSPNCCVAGMLETSFAISLAITDASLKLNK